MVGLFLCCIVAMLPSAETRSTRIDFVLFVDTSLSMVDAMEEAKEYVAGELVGRLVEPGDWVSVYKFYGASERIWQGDIAGETEVADIVRSLKGLEADGRFTDIGSALDTMERVLDERGLPERPKYVLLITDERQEAPRESRYYASDYTARHPLLEYVKREDKGAFRVITIGYGISARVELEARTLLTTLTEPPVRSDPALPGSVAVGTGSTESPSSLAGSGTAPSGVGTQGAATSDTAVPGVAVPGVAVPGDTTPGTGATEPTVQALSSRDATAGRASEADRTGFSGAPLAAGIAAAGALGIALTVFLARRRRRKDEDSRGEAKEPRA